MPLFSDEEFDNDIIMSDDEASTELNLPKVKQVQIKDERPSKAIKFPHKPKQKRRSKYDPNGRDYVCGCGKTYLSYPALYTHLKTKHNNTIPDGTNTTNFQPGRGRGRPRKSIAEAVALETKKQQQALRVSGRDNLGNRIEIDLGTKELEREQSYLSDIP